MLGGVLAVAAVVPTLAWLSAVWPWVVALAGLAAASRLLRGRGRASRHALSRDVLVMAAALLTGGVAESLHSLGLAPTGFFHLTLVGSLALIAVFFLTTESDTRVTARDGTLDGMRFAGYLFLLAAIMRGFLVAADQAHGLAASLAMLLLVIAGFVLTRTAAMSPSAAWRH